MISSFGLQEGLSTCKTKATDNGDKFKMGFLVYCMEISLVQPNVSLIKLAFSTGIVLVL